MASDARRTDRTDRTDGTDGTDTDGTDTDGTRTHTDADHHTGNQVLSGQGVPGEPSRPHRAAGTPPAHPQQECDVLVLGAGLAGLAAARRLHRAGADVVVLEARSRVGGRAWTTTTPKGHRLDRGGQWIGPGQHHLQALADELGVATFPTYTAGQGVEWRDGRRHTYTGLIPTSDPEGAAECVEAILELDLSAMEVSTSSPWLADGAEERDSVTLAAWLAGQTGSPVAEALLDVAVKSVFGVGPDELSLLFALSYLHGGGGLANLVRTTGGAQERRFVGGAQQLALGLAAELGDRVVRSAPVVRVEHRPDLVTVTSVTPTQAPTRTPTRTPTPTASTRTWTARRAIVAMPPSLSARLWWSPPLPPGRDQLSMHLPMGSVTKVHALYDQPFWRDQDLNGQLVSAGGALSSTFDDSPADGSSGVLVGFVAGDQSRHYERRGAAARRRAVLEELARAFGPRAAEPVELVEQHWPAEEFTRGGPVAVAGTGVLTGFGPSLRQPVGAVHWAGTETATEWCGYLDGALSSGERAAAEVEAALGLPSPEPPSSAPPPEPTPSAPPPPGAPTPAPRPGRNPVPDGH